MENSDIARVLQEIGDLLEIKGESAFRIRAYRNATYAIGEATASIAEIALREDGAKALQEIPGIGSSLSEKIVEIVRTGDCQAHRDLLAEIPGGLLELLKVPGVGPKKAKLFLVELNVKSLGDLEKAAREGKLAALAGMGEKSQAKILKGIEQLEASAGRTNIAVALPHAEHLAGELRRLAGVRAVEPAGSLRRRRETVGDIDVLVAADPEAAERVMEAVRRYRGVADVIASGPTKTSVLLTAGLQADVRVVPPESYGAALHYFTGSKAHNVAIRDRGKRRGLKISEYGVFEEGPGGAERRISGEDEGDVFRAVGLPYIAPELRENLGEIEAADEGRLPKLVEIGDIRGDLQMHTTRSDGQATAKEMALRAKAMGYSYIAITDHSRSVHVAGGQTEEQLAEQIEEIRALADDPDLRGITVLAGVECDLLADGSLDLAADALRACDWVLGAVHYRMEMPKDEMTARYVRAIESGLLHALAHPTGRRIGERPEMAMDMEKVLDAVRANGMAVEINAHPERLDLSDIHARRAREKGIPIVISTDSHQPEGLDHMKFGVFVARRAWLEAADVLNTRPLPAFREWLRERRWP